MKLLTQQKFMKNLRFFSSDCKTHSPYLAGTIRDLLNATVAANKEMAPKLPDAELSVKHFLADGDFVAVHTQLLNSKSNPAEGGLRQIHLFRFDAGMIVEYWDVTQQVMPDMPNVQSPFDQLVTG
jgi:predicted SnoaL-like aldol condensation-catalyzing enzyme